MHNAAHEGAPGEMTQATGSYMALMRLHWLGRNNSNNSPEGQSQREHRALPDDVMEDNKLLGNVGRVRPSLGPYFHTTMPSWSIYRAVEAFGCVLPGL